MPRQIEAERATLPKLRPCGGLASAECMARAAELLEATGMPSSMGSSPAEGFALKKQISALSRMARETLGAIE